MSTPPSNNAVIIFDWDDTILPSSFVDKVQADTFRDLPQQYHSIFREIETCAEECLSAAAQHGEVSVHRLYLCTIQSVPVDYFSLLNHGSNL